MKFLSKEDLFGSIVPKPYISKITLESQGYSQPPKISNPHVIPKGRADNDVRESPIGIVASAKELGMLDDPSTLTVSLNLTIKDTVKEVPIFKTGNMELRNYINLCVVQCTDSEMANEILLRSRSGRTLSDQISGLQPNLIKKSLTDIVGENAESITDAVMKEANEKLLIKDISYQLKFDGLDFQPNYLSYFVWTEFDLSEIARQFDFDLTSFDSSSLLSNTTYRSRVIYDVVLSGGKTVDVAHVFRDDTGSIWTGQVTRIADGKWWTGGWNVEGEDRTYRGPTHQMPNGVWMTGATHDSENSKVVSRQLVNRERVRNTRIQDLRSVERLEKVNLDFSYIENSLTNNILATSRMLKEYTNKDSTKKYFSDLYISRDTENNCRFFFGLRKDKILQDFSPLRALYQGNKINTSLYCPVLSMKVYRVRLKGSPEIGSPTVRPHRPYSFGSRDPIEFNRNEYEGTYDFLGGTRTNTSTTKGHELIMEYNFGGTVDSVDNAGSTIQTFGNVFSVNDQNNPNRSDMGVEYFAGIDKSVKNKTDGYYQYKISFEIQDNSPKYLFGLYESLKSARVRLAQYYDKATQLGNTKIKDFTDNPHIENENLTGFKEDGTKIRFSPGDTRPGNFDVALNRFTRHFIQSVASEWSEDFWERIVDDYIFALGGLGATMEPSVRQALINYIQPKTGNPQGIITVMKLIQNLEGIILRGIKGLRPIRATKDDLNGAGQNVMKAVGNSVVRSNIQGQHPPRSKSITIEQQFDAIFNANLPDNLGLDIFGLDPITEETGFRVISGNDFQSIVAAEKEKIFQPSITEVASTVDGQIGFAIDQTSYSYFTPNIVKTPAEDFDLRLQNSPAPLYPLLDTIKKVSMPLSSFMASNYNLIVVPEPEPTIPINAPSFTTPAAVSAFATDTFAVTVAAAATDLERRLDWRDGNVEYETHMMNATFVFSELLDHVDLPADPNKVAKISLSKTKKDLFMYEASNPNGYYNNIVAPTETNVTSWNALPNQIKALFSLANGGLTSNPTNTQTGQVYQNDITQMFQSGLYATMIHRAKSRYKFDTIYTLEYFKGWQNITEGLGASTADGGATPNVSSLLEMSWEPLSQAVYVEAASANKFIFCRLKEYNNPEVGIEFQRELPLFEEYYMIQPTEVPQTQQAPITPPATESGTEEDISEYIYTSNTSEVTFTTQTTATQLSGAIAPTNSGMSVGGGSY